jgi:hypothetical protein
LCVFSTIFLPVFAFRSLHWNGSMQNDKWIGEGIVRVLGREGSALRACFESIPVGLTAGRGVWLHCSGAGQISSFAR